MAFSLKRLLVGKPIPTERAHHERLPKWIALAVFASDALSSTAYATEEIMLALMLTVGFAAAPQTVANLNYVLPIAIGIGILLVIVATSYRQTVYAYPQGGGAYLVAKENFGHVTGLVAAAALLIAYVLTVSISIAAGVAAITSAFPELKANPAYTIYLCMAFIALVMLLNLRGMKESGVIFAIPTYGFILAMLTMLGVGFYRHFNGGLAPYAPLEHQQTLPNPHFVQSVGIFMLMRAFASGCTALTGIEAISDGVPAFRPPESRNAAITLGWMAAILVSIFVSITTLTYLSGSQPILALAANGTQFAATHGHLEGQETLVSVLARRTFEGTGIPWFYYVIQAMTAAILVLAANTAYADFPRLSSVMARDRFMPRQMANVGDRLAFNNGIVILSFFSALLIIIFQGSVTRLIALYALGVFLSFTLSQAGMVMHWRKLRPPRWKINATVNAVGAIATLIVTLIIGATKFAAGAWMVVIAIPILVFILRRINTHYRSVAKQLSLEGYRPQQGMRHHVFVLVPDIHRGVIPALQYARSMSPDARALHVSIDPSREKRLKERWELFSRGVPLTLLPSPYRSLVDPVVDYIKDIQAQEPRSLVTMVIPEFVPRAWWAKLLHGQAGLLLTLRLHEIKGVVVVNVPYVIEAFVELKPGEDPAAHSAVPHHIIEQAAQSTHSSH